MGDLGHAGSRGWWPARAAARLEQAMLLAVSVNWRWTGTAPTAADVMPGEAGADHVGL